MFALAPFCRFPHIVSYKVFEAFNSLLQPGLTTHQWGLRLCSVEEVQKDYLHLLLGESCNLHKNLGRNTSFPITFS